ncbi:extracellular solute-binding protein [Streptomyces sp. NPDC052109]|uniref:ABC transporter substrate-binding protein n=1 Tax=Streptomyces sp. NPDC052109 TaxID=3155527 RepID=UPI0034213D0F
MVVRSRYLTDAWSRRLTGTSRVLAAAAACALAATGLSACSGDSGGSSENTLVVAEWTNAAAVAQTEKINAAFEKAHPGVTVKLQTAPTAANAWPTLQNSLLASKNVDVLAQFPPTPAAFPPEDTKIKVNGTAALVANNQFMDLSKQPFMKRFDLTAQKYAMGYKDGVYGVMTAEYVNNTGLWYKKDLLDKYGLKVPTTYDEFVSDLKLLKSKGLSPVYVAGKDGYQNIVWAGIINQLLMQDKPATDAQSVYRQRAEDFWDGKANWDDPIYQDAAKRYEEVMSYIEPNAAGVPAQTAPGVWASNTDDYPFFVDGSYDGNTIAQANPNLKFGFFAVPGTDNAAWNRPALAPDLSWSVPVWAKHKKLALEYLDFFTQKSTYADWVKATGSISTEPDVPTPSLSWTDWLTANASKGYPNSTQPWIPTSGSSTHAGGPTLTEVKPFGSKSMTTALSEAAKAYTASVKH